MKMENFVDKLAKIKRGPAIILPKDAGLIITQTGVGKNSVVVDAGTGSGVLAFYLSNTAKHVTTYENRKEFYKIAKENIHFMGIKNIKLKNKDIYKGVDEKNLDLITLDLASPWKVLKHAEKALKQRAFLVTYLPTIVQVVKFVQELNKYRSKFKMIKVVELLEREWYVEDRVRPKSQMIAHTAWLVFVRKI